MPIAEMVGASFTDVTVKVNWRVAVSEPSLTVSVIVAEPFWLVAGCNCTVREFPVPPSMMRLVGMSVVSLEVALTVRLAAAVSASETVNDMAAG